MNVINLKNKVIGKNLKRIDSILLEMQEKAQIIRDKIKNGDYEEENLNELYDATGKVLTEEASNILLSESLSDTLLIFAREFKTKPNLDYENISRIMMEINRAIVEVFELREIRKSHIEFDGKCPL